MIDDFILGLAAVMFGSVLFVMALPARSLRWRRRVRPDEEPGPEPEIHRLARLARATGTGLALLVGIGFALGGLTVAGAALYGVDVTLLPEMLGRV